MQTSVTAAYFPTEETDDMAATLGDRVLDVEKALHSLQGYVKGALAVGVILVGAIGWWVTQEIVPAIHTLQTTVSSDENRIGALEGEFKNLDLRRLAAKNPTEALKEINALPQEKFAKALPALQDVVSLAPETIKPSTATLQDIADKLRHTDHGTPEYWPTVLHFLQFATAGMAPSDVPPPGGAVGFDSSSHSLFEGNVFNHLIVRLNGGLVRNTRFQNCRVIFTDTPVQMVNVVFVNSVFEFPISASPTPYIQNASKVLLASDLKTVSFSGL